MGFNLDETVFLTFDIDWAPDPVIDYTYQILKNQGIPGTFFVTHATPYLSVLRKDGQMELGIHPNFNGYFSKADVGRTPREMVEALLQLVPEARAYRSHALTHSSILNDIYQPPLTINCNVFIPGFSGITLLPYRDYCGPLVMPYYFEDDANLLGSHAVCWSPEAYLDRPGLKIFDFHPVHVFLNTKTQQQYNRAKPYYQQPDLLATYRDADAGIHGADGFLRAIIAEAKARGYQFAKISDICSTEARGQ